MYLFRHGRAFTFKCLYLALNFNWYFFLIAILPHFTKSTLVPPQLHPLTFEEKKISISSQYLVLEFPKSTKVSSHQILIIKKLNYFNSTFIFPKKYTLLRPFPANILEITVHSPNLILRQIYKFSQIAPKLGMKRFTKISFLRLFSFS